MFESDLKIKLQNFLETKGLRFDMDPEEAEAKLQEIMPSSRFNKYLEAAFSMQSEGGAPTEIYRVMTTRAEANTLIAQQAEVYLDTNTAVIEKIKPYLKPDTIVWEMGCMNGLCAEWLAENNPEIHVYGVDRVGQVLRDASKKHTLKASESRE